MRADPVTRAGSRLARALLADAAAAGFTAVVLDACGEPWESATFSGSVHRVRVAAAASPAREAWVAALPDAELSQPGQLVASLAVRADGAELVVEALVLMEE